MTDIWTKLEIHAEDLATQNDEWGADSPLVFDIVEAAARGRELEAALRERSDEETRCMTGWRRWFAWHPVQLIGGRRAWLRFVERNQRDNGIKGSHGHDWWYVYRRATP